MTCLQGRHSGFQKSRRKQKKGNSMIRFDHVTKTYKTNVGLDDVSVHIKKGDFVFLVGPSGAGKSTFIKLILKEIDADRGSIVVDGQEVTRLSNREIPQYRRKLGTVFQDFRLLPKKTVFENVAFAMEVLHKTPRQIRKQVPQVLSLVGISDKAHKYPEELSAGEQQRVAIARAIVNNPTVLIADEPTGNLDPDTAWEIMDLLEQINLRGTTIVMVTHAKDIVDRMKKRVIAVEEGRVVRDEQGTYGFEQTVCTRETTEMTSGGAGRKDREESSPERKTESKRKKRRSDGFREKEERKGRRAGAARRSERAEAEKTAEAEASSAETSRRPDAGMTDAGMPDAGMPADRMNEAGMSADEQKTQRTQEIPAEAVKAAEMQVSPEKSETGKTGETCQTAERTGGKEDTHAEKSDL